VKLPAQRAGLAGHVPVKGSRYLLQLRIAIHYSNRDYNRGIKTINPNFEEEKRDEPLSPPMPRVLSKRRKPDGMQELVYMGCAGCTLNRYS
jgi:hypothetical protein